MSKSSTSQFVELSDKEFVTLRAQLAATILAGMYANGDSDVDRNLINVAVNDAGALMGCSGISVECYNA